MKSHIVIGIAGLEARLNAAKRDSGHGFWKFLTDDTGRFLTMQEVRNEIERCRELGYKVIPTCENIDDRGYCKGHPDDK